MVDGLLQRFKHGGLAQVQRASVSATEGRGYAPSCGQAVAQGGPTGGVGVLAQAATNDLDQLIGDDGDEQMAFGASGHAMVDGPQAEFGFQDAEHGFQVGQCGVGSPQPLGVPVQEVAAQTVHAGQVGPGARGGIAGPGERVDAIAIDGHRELVIRGDMAVLRLEPTDAFVDLLGFASRTGSRQAVRELRQRSLVACAQALDHGTLLPCALFGVAVQADFTVVLADPPVQVQGVPGGSGDGLGGGGGELAHALAADHQVAVTGVPQPGELRFGGDAPVRDHQGVLRRGRANETPRSA